MVSNSRPSPPPYAPDQQLHASVRQSALVKSRIDTALLDLLGDAESLVVRVHHLNELAGHTGAVDREMLAQIAREAGAARLGLEPSPEFAPAALTPQDAVVIFRLGTQPLPGQWDEYRRGAILLSLSAAVAVADGLTCEAEQAALERLVEDVTGVDAPQRARLRAYLRWLLVSGPLVAKLLARLRRETVSEREELVTALVDLAAVDGRIHPEELELLRRTSRAVGVPEQRLYDTLDRLDDDVHREWELPRRATVSLYPEPLADENAANTNGQRGHSGRPSKRPSAPKTDQPKVAQGRGRSDALLELLFG